MATPVLNHLDGGKVAQLQNFLVQPLASAPSTPAQGQMYFDTTIGALGICTNATGPVWQYVPITQALLNTTYDAQSIVVAVSDNTPVVATVGTSGTVGRIPGVNSGNVGALTWAQVKTELGALNTFTAPTGALSMNSQLITNVATPVSGTDAATKAYADSVAAGLDWKESVRAATTANITLSGAQTIDGVSVIAGDRVLVKNQTTASGNGIYVAAAGAWSRSTDADASAEVTSGQAVFVEEGTANGDKGFTLTTNNPITLGSTSLTYTQFSGTGGTGTVIKFAQTIGDGSSTSIVVTHSIGSDDVGIHVYNISSGLEVWCDKARTSTTQATLGFATAPASNALRVVVFG